MIRIFGDEYTRNGTVLVVVYPGVMRRFPDRDAADRFVARYVSMGGRIADATRPTPPTPGTKMRAGC